MPRIRGTEPPVDPRTQPDGPARSSVELLDRPWVFTQLKPLTADQFVRHAQLRGYEIVVQDLEALHRKGILVPLLRVSRDGRRLRADIRRSARAAHDHDHWDPSNWVGTRRLMRTASQVRWHDPAIEPVRRWGSRKLAIDGHHVALDQYLYSPYQAIAFPFIRRAFRFFHYVNTARGAVAQVRPPTELLKGWQATDRRLRGAIIAATALEARYRPDIFYSYSTEFGDEAEYLAWRQTPDRGETAAWLGVDADWLWQTGAWLLNAADKIDPLGDWLDVIRTADPARWDRLRGDALLAMDARIVSELLLAAHDAQLGGEGVTRASRTSGARRPLQGRLTSKRTVDEVLTEYGLSPHPRLIVVLEGVTEMYMWPRLLRHFGISTDEDFITPVDRGGVDRDIETLIAYAAPRVVPTKPEGTLRLTRPPTRILIITDPESKMATEKSRLQFRRIWVNRLMRTLPADYRHPVIRGQLSHLVSVETWNEDGDAFEFANFTTREIATALRKTSSPLRFCPHADVTVRMETFKQQHRGLKSLGSSAPKKGELAAQLWPILESRLNRQTGTSGTVELPVVRLVWRAYELATEWSRRSVQVLGPVPQAPATTDPDPSGDD